MTRIKDLPVDDRPRERLLKNGVSSLSNEELLSILFKTGTKNSSVKDLSYKVLSSIKNISALKTKNYHQLIQFKGIGPSKACVLLASIELGKRIQNDFPSIFQEKFQSAEKIYLYYFSLLQEKKQEHFYAVYLDSQKRIVQDKLLFIGTLNYSIVHPRDVFKEACLVDAAGIIIIHNHPSGSVIPSSEDFQMTKRLIEVGKTMGIPIIDHIVIGQHQYYSFYENGDIL